MDKQVTSFNQLTYNNESEHEVMCENMTAYRNPPDLQNHTCTKTPSSSELFFFASGPLADMTKGGETITTTYSSPPKQTPKLKRKRLGRFQTGKEERDVPVGEESKLSSFL